MNEQARAEFAAYVAARSGALLRTAYLLVGNRHDAEDLLQQALAKTYLAWERIEKREAADAYVRRVMVNTRTSWWRKRRVDEYPTALLPERTGRDETAGVDLHDALWRSLAKLPRRQRAVLVLRYYEDLPEAEVARILEISPGTVKSTTSKALGKLRSDPSLRTTPTDSVRLALPEGAL